MKRPQRLDRLSETPRDQFRTLSRPATTAVSKTTTSRRIRSPDSLASARAPKRILPSTLRAQPTLTQIDFVTQPTHSDDDEQLDYIEQPRPRGETQDTNESARINDGSDGDADYRRPPTARSARISKFGIGDRERFANEHPPKRTRSSKRESDRSLRKSETPRAGTPRAGVGTKRNRKSLEKSAGKRDKTLTQMDFVRRYITIDDDDGDVNMGYIQPATAEKSAQDGPPAHVAETKEQDPQPQQFSAKGNRKALEVELDLSTGEPISQSSDTQHTNFGNARREGTAPGPVTPQKPRRLEIPSSQSPESPGLAIITSSQFRSATRSPLKQKSSNLAQHPSEPVKEEPAERQLASDAWHMLKVPDSLTRQPSDPAGNPAIRAPSTESTWQGLWPEGNDTPRDKHTNKERTVVYNTDAETDYEDSEDGLDGSLASPHPGNGARKDMVHDTQNSREPSKDDSQELPLPPVQSSAEVDSSLPAEALLSDASICYQRLHPATQFPHEPIPELNTQKLADLFPHENSSRDHQAEPPRRFQEHAGSSLQTQTQSQDADKLTDFVPESSPAREQEQQNSIDTPFQRPRTSGSVVQVESSQPVDRSLSRPRILSRSQLLTSSVMESIPLPNFWIGSQDSVGEPYSLPDGRWE